jgi:hypothetical protein
MKPDDLIQQRLTEDSLRQLFEQTLSERAQRYLKIKPHGVIPFTPFAPPSSECGLLFRDGHFYGCIALTQAVAEALTRFLCTKNGWKPAKIFETNIDKLHKRGFILHDIKKKFLNLWQNRDDYHHLNPEIETNLKELEKIAFEKILYLKEIEAEMFAFSINDGKLIPKYPKYWSIGQDGIAQVMLRLG